LPLAMRYAAGSNTSLAVSSSQFPPRRFLLASSSSLIALLSFPFIYSYPLHMGFYNFCIGVVLTFVTLGYARRHARPADANFGPRAVIALLLLLLYFSHILAWCITVGALFGFALWDALGERRTPDWLRRTALRVAM